MTHDPILGGLLAGTLTDEQLRTLDAAIFAAEGKSFAEFVGQPLLLVFPQWEQLLELDFLRYLEAMENPLLQSLADPPATPEEEKIAEEALARIREKFPNLFA